MEQDTKQHIDTDATSKDTDTIGSITPTTEATVHSVSSQKTESDVTTETTPTTTNYCLQAFYYMWYANETVDKQYYHWNHKFLPHWNKNIASKYQQGEHHPPDDIGASFYPQLGCYSSASPSLIKQHMLYMKEAGIGVVVVSWYPPTQSDDNGLSPDPLIPRLLDIAHAHGLKVVLHSEPYASRSPSSFRDDLQYIYDHYYQHPALLKAKTTSRYSQDTRPRPIVYVYDSYLSSSSDWSQVLTPQGSQTIRDTPIDAIVIGLLVSMAHSKDIINGGFDGFYTYFASDGFSYGSTVSHWTELLSTATQNGLVFIPSVGPGYEDTQVRPWNGKNSKDRKDGLYYKKMMSKAVSLNTDYIITITSFNEWHEGTQIEPAVPKKREGFTYLDYSPHPPNYYLQLTKEYSEIITCNLKV